MIDPPTLAVLSVLAVAAASAYGYYRGIKRGMALQSEADRAARDEYLRTLDREVGETLSRGHEAVAQRVALKAKHGLVVDTTIEDIPGGWAR